MIAWMLACGASEPQTAPVAPVPSAARDARCPVVGPAVELGKVANAELTELSGLVKSRRHAVFWAHNDSGDTPRVFALGPDGADVGRLTITGAEAVDWEDMALIPGETHDWLVLADIGDNREVRPTVQLYRVPEPMPGATMEAVAERMVVRWPKSPFNAETLLVDPRSGELFVVSKVKDGESSLYGLGPWVTGEVEGRLLGSRAFPPGKSSVKTTAGDVSPDARWLVVRTYTQAHLFPITGSLAEAFLQAPCDVPTPEEPQGEAITFVDGGLVVVSEGLNPPLYRIPLTTP